MKRWVPVLVLAAGLLLPQTVAFGQSDTKAADTKPAANSKQDAASEADEDKKLTVPELVRELLKEKQLKKAEALVDQMDQNSTEVDNFRTSLTRAFAAKQNYAGAVRQLEKQLEAEMAKEKPAAVKLVSSVNFLRLYLPRANRPDDVMPTIQKVKQLLTKSTDLTKASAELEALLRLRATENYALRMARQNDEATAIFEEDLELTKGLYASEKSAMAARLYTTSMRNLMGMLTDTAARNEILTQHQDITSEFAEKGNAEMATAYVQAAISEASRSYRADPERTEGMLEVLKEFIDHHSQDEKMAARLKNYGRSIATIETRLEASRKLLAMIGKPAPAIDEDVTWVGSDGPIDTQGKVVLLDFWALWCGPCIATFPHLKHLTEEYGDQGFQVVGVTRYYNYTWDEEAGRAVSGDRKAAPNPEVENEVLKKFLASHELTHPTVVVSADSTMHKDYGVSGIPHVALIDQEGHVQLVKVGSGKENSMAIEAKIRELLGLSPVEESEAGE